MRRPRAGAWLLAALALANTLACKADQGAGELHAKVSALEREVEGMRASVAKLERGEPILPEDAVVVAVSEAVVREFLVAQLPFEAETDKFKVRLTEGEAIFRGSPAVRLAGTIWRPENPNLVGEVRAQGALENIRVDPETGTLRANVALDHVDLVQMAGLEKLIAGGSLNELARTVRLQIADRLPALQIPVKIEQAVELPYDHGRSGANPGRPHAAGGRGRRRAGRPGRAVGGGEGRARRADESQRRARHARAGRADESPTARRSRPAGPRRWPRWSPSRRRVSGTRPPPRADEGEDPGARAGAQGPPGAVGELIAKDPRLQGMPATDVRVGVPTVLARTLIERVVTGFVDSVTLTLRNLKVKKSGTVKKVITLGQYDLRVEINEVSGRLKTGKPRVTFGGNKVALELPVKVASGTGNADIDFKWDGKNVSGAVCGDMEVTQQVAGGVKPDEYEVAGALHLTATARAILASPKFPVVRINLKVEPSPESWAAVQKILDDKEGVCGFVVDKVDIRGVLEGLVGKGFNVRLPTEKIKPMAIPVGIAPTMKVGDETVRIEVKVSNLAITEHMIWLGADVTLGHGDAGTAKVPGARKKPPAPGAKATPAPLSGRRADGGRYSGRPLAQAPGRDRSRSGSGTRSARANRRTRRRPR